MPRFTRIPYDVEAYRVTKSNLEDLVNFSTVPHIGFRSYLTENKDGILVRGVGTLQSAYVGDWVVRLESGHIETLTDRKFNSRYKLAFVPECSDDCGHTDCNCGYQPVSNGEVGTNPSGLGADYSTPEVIPDTSSELCYLYNELGTLKWIGADEGWDKAIDTVRKEILKRVSNLKDLRCITYNGWEFWKQREVK